MFPDRPEDITPAWLSRALAPHHPGIEVVDVRLGRIGRGTNTHVRLRLTFALESDVPCLLFAKMPPLDPERRAAVNRTGMGAREVRFYRHLAPSLPMRVPAAYAAYLDPDSGSFLLLFEDLDTTGCTLPDPVAAVGLEAARQAMEDFAALHVRYEDPVRRDAEAAWVQPARRGSDYGARLLREGLRRHRHRLTAGFAELAEVYLERQDTLYDLWRQGPLTVIHGDAHVGNLFMDHERLGFLDWGLINVGSPMRDVSYFCTMALSPATRRAHERELIELYLDRRRALGGTPIDLDDAWLQHRIHAAYTVPASCQIVTFPDNLSAARERFAAAFLERSEQAIDDLDPRRALAEVAGI